MAELHVHGGAAVVEGVSRALTALGLRMAEPGEFARRAFENGKIDLTQAEGLADLIDAETEAQRIQAQRQSSGALRAVYDGWRERIIEAMALVEAAIDFSDEADIPREVFAKARPLSHALAAEIAAHLADGRRGEILRDGLHVVIAGAPNAGKSSLLNALAQREAAIVSEEAGTTRDIIEVRMNLGGYPFIFSDTAGIRDAPGAVEREGVRRAVCAAESADLILWLEDASATPSPPLDDIGRHSGKVIRLDTKTDLARPRCGLGVSVATGAGLPELLERLIAEAKSRLGADESVVITRQRHRQELEVALAALQRFLSGADIEPELRAEDLRDAGHAIGRITGRVDVEQVLGQIFAQFCIGK
jgi:tRNA modification GTPase